MDIQVCQPPPCQLDQPNKIPKDTRFPKHTTVSVTNGVGVHARGELELDRNGAQLEKLRNRAGWKGLRRASRPSRNKERPVFMVHEEERMEVYRG